MSSESKGKKAHILAVEDDTFLAELLNGYLKKAGFDCDLAVDGPDGLQKAREHKPDLILLDLLLPGMDGYHFLQEIKADKALADVPVIILSNLGEEVQIKKGLELGAVDFMIKAHHTLDEVADRVQKFLKM